MRNLTSHLIVGLIMSLIASCSSLQSSQDHSSCIPERIIVPDGRRPEIPFTPDKAFFPLRVNQDGKIVPSYSWDVCVKRIVICLKWQQKIVYFNDLEWFYNSEYGLMKRPAR